MVHLHLYERHESDRIMSNELLNVNNQKVTLDEISENVIAVHQRNNWRQRTYQERMLYLISEVGELATVLIEVDNVRSVSTDDLKVRISEEMADVIWNICALAIGLDIDLNVAVNGKLQKMIERVWDNAQ